MDQTRLQKVFRDIFDEPALVLRRDMTAADVDAWDSLSHIALLAAVEKEFGVRFNLADVKGLKNVGDLMDVLEKKGA
ncbi:MAG TPA: acyl carrier protein [bacterium]|jgi:acyl carrier protein|nr:acyl carrier protein [bacterium]HXC64826.1 acyl carrier protein [bacterium]